MCEIWNFLRELIILWIFLIHPMIFQRKWQLCPWIYLDFNWLFTSIFLVKPLYQKRNVVSRNTLHKNPVLRCRHFHLNLLLKGKPPCKNQKEFILEVKKETNSSATFPQLSHSTTHERIKSAFDGYAKAK